MIEIYLKSKVHGNHTVKIDDEDYEKIAGINWWLKENNRSFYACGRRHYKDKIILMHRLIMDVAQSTIFVDHQDQNGLNNQKNNLRLCTPGQNQCNRRPSKSGTSKYLGVSFDKETNKWVANLTKNYKKHWIGVFTTQEEAAEAYKQYAQKLHGEFASSILTT